MLYVCAGMEKGGTTYTYNLIKLLLAGAGHPYIHLSNALRGDHRAKERDANNLKVWSSAIVDNLRAHNPKGDRILALRTHSEPYQPMVDLLKATGGKTHIAIRDPRDVALSLMDVSAKRLATQKENRAGIVLDDFATTFPEIHKNINAVTGWSDQTDCLTLYYEDTCFRPEVSIGAICSQLKLDVDKNLYQTFAREAALNPNGKLNVGKPMRHTKEMSARNQSLFLEEFAEFYQRFFPAATVHAEDGAGLQPRVIPSVADIRQSKIDARNRAKQGQ
jgi:hypothetical protein